MNHLISKLFLYFIISYTLLIRSTLSIESEAVQTVNFKNNPGNLEMFSYSPKLANESTPLLVVLHGCTQTVADFDDESGWIKLAQENNFHILFPQQRIINNQWRCFNWFRKGDTSKGKGEMASIISMIQNMQENHSIDINKIYITGLSAGGAMSMALISHYPDIFKAGAIAAGVPYKCATKGSLNASSCMKDTITPPRTREMRGKSVLKASTNYKGIFPKLFVIHGELDEVITVKKSKHIIEQWTYIHETDDEADNIEETQDYIKSDFKKDKEIIATSLVIKNMKHGYSIDENSSCGVSGKHILNTGICAARLTAKFFNLIK